MPIDQRSLISAAKRFARVAGAVYLLFAFLGGAARLGVHAGIPIPGQAPPADSTAVQVSVVAAIAVAMLLAFVGVTLSTCCTAGAETHCAAQASQAVGGGWVDAHPLSAFAGRSCRGGGPHRLCEGPC